MATSPRYTVVQAFAYPTGKMIQTPDGEVEERVYFTRENQHEIEEVLSAEDIQDRVDRGLLHDSQALIEDHAALAAHEESIGQGEETQTRRRSRSRR